jgi:broad specificity phosphatase PhoE
MVKTIHLVRHGHHALLGTMLCGRMPGVTLDELGCRQMEIGAERILPVPTAVQSSPQQRAVQSASILAKHLGLAIEIVAAVDEIDVGDWTGRSFDELEKDPDWHRWNSRRGSNCPPKGESMLCLQRRVVAHLELIRADACDGAILIVSHAEPIRAALLHYANAALDDFFSIDVAPASISTLCFDRRGAHIAQANQRISV